MYLYCISISLLQYLFYSYMSGWDTIYFDILFINLIKHRDFFNLCFFFFAGKNIFCVIAV